jgi:hypothetical protein
MASDSWVLSLNQLHGDVWVTLTFTLHQLDSCL